MAQVLCGDLGPLVRAQAPLCPVAPAILQVVQAQGIPASEKGLQSPTPVLWPLGVQVLRAGDGLQALGRQGQRAPSKSCTRLAV